VLATAVLGSLVLLPGIPLALVVGRGGDEERRWSGVLVEALLLGLCWWLLLGLWFSHAGWFAPWQLLLPTLAVTAVAWALAIPMRVRRPELTWFGGAIATLSMLAVWLRSEPFYFLFQIGDFGEYVNRANAVADGGGFIGWFTQGFTVALAMTHLALGEASTVDLMPFLGVVLLAVTVELARRLGAPPIAQAVVAVIMAVGEVPVWFGRFPASETLYAVLQVGLVLLVVTAVQRGSTRLAMAGGVVCGLLLVTRGNGILLGPIVVLTVLLGALVVSRRTLDVLVRFTWAAMLSLGAAFVFNARFSHPYFIAEQLPKFVPDPLFRHLEGMGGLRFAAPRLLLLVAGTWGLTWLARRVHGRVSPERVALVLGAMAAVAVVVIVVVFDARGIADALGRYDVVVEVLAVVGLGAALWRFRGSLDDAQRIGVVLVVLVCGAFAVLYAERLPLPRYAPYHLYWDRYLFSELFPLMVLATMWAVALLVKRVPAPVLGAGVVALGVWLHSQAGLTREDVFMDDAYGQLQAIAEAIPEEGFYFVGILPQDVPGVLCHPNTHRIVASPLATTFNRPLLNGGLAPYAPDPQPGDVEVPDGATVVQVVAGDEPDGFPLVIPLLDRPLGVDRESDPLNDCNERRQGEPRWRDAHFTVIVSQA
jgi:hypothetical protein